MTTRKSRRNGDAQMRSRMALVEAAIASSDKRTSRMERKLEALGCDVAELKGTIQAANLPQLQQDVRNLSRTVQRWVGAIGAIMVILDLAIRFLGAK